MLLRVIGNDLNNDFRWTVYYRPEKTSSVFSSDVFNVSSIYINIQEILHFWQAGLRNGARRNHVEAHYVTQCSVHSKVTTY
jgi:hypothetical protein